ncbi:c-type cytochrome [Parasphingorhabdus cellanae]|uniref:Cytochrome c family protein n=1 Tax=Parasphingorhabdus cellanae TaxID=2806553 RepID=A0ABX7T728_9SPHN|nr:cytochrome c family protein [Parasphingorhabdus cellanae]QTD57413.1 cytochrome c family protein [Parasphingorhabdus cellanae]
MDNNNTIAGWVLAGGIAALGFSILSGKYFHADGNERPETMGYIIEGVETADSGTDEVPMSMMLAKADIAAGEAVFKKCIACHTINQGGANGIGPNLYDSLGKPHGHVAGFAYSDALKSIEGDWNFDNMNAWLISPRKYAPGTKMTFAGLGKPEDRANVIAYMNAQGSNLPYPEPPTEEAPAEGEEVVDAGAPAEAEAAAAAEQVAEETAEASEAAAEE